MPVRSRVGLHVRGAGRQRTENDLQADDSVQDFIDSAVAALPRSTIKTAGQWRCDPLPGHFQIEVVGMSSTSPPNRQDIDGGIETRPLCTFQSTCAGIKDDGYTL